MTTKSKTIETPPERESVKPEDLKTASHVLALVHVTYGQLAMTRPWTTPVVPWGWPPSAATHPHAFPPGSDRWSDHTIWPSKP